MHTRTIGFDPILRAEPRLQEPSCLTIDACALGMLEAEVRELRRDLATIRQSVAELSRARHEARGSWRAIAIMIPLVSATCAAATLLLRLHLW